VCEDELNMKAKYLHFGSARRVGTTGWWDGELIFWSGFRSLSWRTRGGAVNSDLPLVPWPVCGKVGFFPAVALTFVSDTPSHEVASFDHVGPVMNASDSYAD